MPARTLTRILVLLTVLSALLFVGGCAKTKTDAPSLGLKPGASQGGMPSAGTTDGAETPTTDPKKPGSADSTQGSTSAGSGTSAQGGTTGGGGEAGKGDTSGSGSSSQPGAAAKLIRIKWWNDTQAVPPKNPVIEFGGKRVRPKAGKSDTLAIGPCPVGRDLTFAIYPDGTAGKRIVATFRVEARMIADSEQDAIHVEVRDDRVRVLGNPIPNFERTFER